MILDACFLIDLLDGDEAAAAKLAEIEDELLAVPSLVRYEVGIGIDPDTEEGRRFEAVMDDVTVAPFDAAAAKRAVDVQRQLYAGGEPVGDVDAMVAGIALARDEPVVTRNAAEFARTPVRISPY